MRYASVPFAFEMAATFVKYLRIYSSGSISLGLFQGTATPDPMFVTDLNIDLKP
jgi:hypothetical protein